MGVCRSFTRMTSIVLLMQTRDQISGNSSMRSCLKIFQKLQIISLRHLTRRRA